MRIVKAPLAKTCLHNFVMVSAAAAFVTALVVLTASIWIESEKLSYTALIFGIPAALVFCIGAAVRADNCDRRCDQTFPLPWRTQPEDN